MHLEIVVLTNKKIEFSIETLRKHPPGPVIMRKAKNDYRIEHEKGNHFILKKGTHVIIPNYAIQHDAEYFENPEEFKATRFSKPLQRNMTWLPFGDGEFYLIFFC